MTSRINWVLLMLLGCNDIMGQNPATLPGTYSSQYKPGFVRVWESSSPQSDATQLSNRPLREVKQVTVYYDGAGREIETITKQGSKVTTGTDALDMISARVYDVTGREQYRYLPFASTASGSSKNDGSFKTDPFQQQAAFYNNQLSGQSGETNIGPGGLNWAYGYTKFEESPLNRPAEIFAAGSSWVGTSYQSQETDRHSVKMKYWTNTSVDAVRIWTVTDPSSVGNFGTYASSGIYTAGTLTKTVAADEKGKQVIEFKDKAGRSILKKVQATAAADNGNGSGHDGWLCTYNIYDNLGNLRCTITPRGVEMITGVWALTDATLLAEQCYRYEYDARNRLIMSKIPGAGEEYRVNDNKGRLVMSQDANMRNGSPVKWLVTLYDKYDRPVQSGLWSDANSLAYHLTQANNTTAADYPFSESTVPGTGYERLTRMGYDTYSTLPSGTGLTTSFDNTYTSNSSYFYTTYNSSPEFAQAFTVSTQTRGMTTWTESKVLNSSPVVYLYTIQFYDEKGRLIQVKKTNIAGGVDVLTTQYNWAGQMIRELEKQEMPGSPSQTSLVLTQLTYDDLGRITETDKKTQNTLINSNQLPAVWTTIAKNEYDALGQLKAKMIGGRKDESGNYTGVPLETMAYDYNVRGWMLGMNRAYLATQGQSGSSHFGFELGYDKQANSTGQNFTTSPQLNGNITGIVWKSDGDDIRRKYDFTYDETYRMLKADFVQQNADDGLWNNNQVNYSVQWGNGITGSSAYDANGNIKAVTRYGYRPGVSASSPIDQLTYNYMYDNSSNRLLNVIDGANDPATTLGDFRTSLLHTQTKTSTTVDFTYDDNGNMVKDLNKDLVTYNGNKGLTYNYLNLTEKATVKKDGTADKGTITYTYDASGMKLKKAVYETGVTVPYNGSNYTSDITTETIYIGEFVYETKGYSNGTLNTGLGYTKRLQFILHEEGRTRVKIVNSVLSLQYDYFIRDHIGNIRMVLTEENSPASVYEAGMEVADRSNEIQLFSQIPETEYDKPGGFDNLPMNENGKVSKLFNSSGNDKRTGPMLVLKVMAGDKFRASVYEWYQPGNTNVATLPGASDIATNIINALLSGLPAGSKYSGAELNSSGVLNAPLGGFLTYQETQNNGSKPKAFLNWMVLDDEQFKLVTGNYGAVQVESITGSDTKKAITAAGGGEIEIIRNGYLIVYVSNESQGSVYFDQLHIEHIRGPLTEETHYYPAGMQMTGISSQALNDTYRANEYNYQGQEYEGSLGLNMLEFEARMYDPQLGRWHVPDPASQFASPYTGMGNNWINGTDPDGQFFFVPIIIGATVGAFMGGVHADMNGKSFLSGAWKGAIVGGVGGSLSLIGGGTFFAQVAWGAGEGVATNGLNNILNNHPFLKGAGTSALIGGGFAAITAGIESYKNWKDGYGFGTNDGRVKKMVKEYLSSVGSPAENDVANGAIDFAQKRYGMDATAMSYNKYEPDYGVTDPKTGIIEIGPAAFKSSSYLKYTMVHEFGHSLYDRILDANGNFLRWRYNKNNFRSFSDGILDDDGPLGYSMEFLNAGRLHAGLLPLKTDNFLWKKYQLFLNMSKNNYYNSKWLYTIPLRFTNHKIIFKPW